MVIKRFNQETRYRIARIMANGGWWGALVTLVVAVSLGGMRPVGSAPPWLGLIAVFLIGVGIAGGQSLGRQRLTAAITQAFDVGYQVKADERLDEVAERQNQILDELRESRDERNQLVRDLQKEISNR